MYVRLTYLADDWIPFRSDDGHFLSDTDDSYEEEGEIPDSDPENTRTRYSFMSYQ